MVLPAAYGLSVYENPEDFGHSDRHFSVVTDSEGSFSYSFGVVIYHIGIWLIPPIGAYPRRPPAPVLYIWRTRGPTEYYAVAFTKRGGEYRIYDLETNTELPSSRDGIVSIEGHDVDDKDVDDKDTRGTRAILNLVVRTPSPTHR